MTNLWATSCLMGKMKAFPQKSRTKHGCLFSPLILDITLEFLPRAIRQEEELQIGKESI
jgi:hypothetical protein